MCELYQRALLDAHTILFSETEKFLPEMFSNSALEEDGKKKKADPALDKTREHLFKRHSDPHIILSWLSKISKEEMEGAFIKMMTPKSIEATHLHIHPSFFAKLLKPSL